MSENSALRVYVLTLFVNKYKPNNIDILQQWCQKTILFNYDLQ